MRTSFVIYFLFTIMIGNVLHASEDFLRRQEEFSASQDSTDLILENLVIGVDSDAGSEGELKTSDEKLQLSPKPPMVNDGIIASFADLEALATQLVLGQKKRGGNQNNSLEIPKKVLDSLQVDPAFFTDYVTKKKIMKEDAESEYSCVRSISNKLGYIKRLLYCKRRKKNPFEYAQKNTQYQYKRWWQTILKKSCFEFVEKSQPVQTRSRLEDADEYENEKNIRELTKKFEKCKLENEEHETHTKIRKFLEEREKEENDSDKYKDWFYEIVKVVGAFAGGVFGLGS